MCGILGYSNTKELDKFTFETALGLLKHRGPDGFKTNHFSTPYSNVYLGHTRLSIIDIQGGTQPMPSCNEDSWITFNGEIYNYLEIRNEFKNRYNFRTKNSDTESILAAYSVQGKDCLNMLDGMFAIGIYNKKTSKILIARDRFGVKPLYYSKFNNTFIFSSEIKSIIAVSNDLGVIDEESISSFWMFSHIPAPFTAYKNINKVCPGQWLEYDLKTGNLESGFYYKFKRDNKITDYEEAECAFTNALGNTLEKYSRSDVGMTSLLSGGVDSSLLTLELSSKNKISSAFHSLCSEEDTEDARALSAFTNLNLIEEKRITSYSLDDIVEELSLLDEPLGDASLFPSCLIASSIKSSGFKVAFSGDGLDELGMGYSLFQDWNFSKQQQNSILGQILLIFQKTKIPRLNAKASRFKKADDLKSHYYNTRHFNKNYSLFSSHESLEKVYRGVVNSDLDLMNYICEDLTKYYLPNEILCKTDYASMKHSVEYRIPFLSNEITDILSSIDSNILLRKKGKSVAKSLLRKSCSHVNPYRIKKGFISNYDYIFKKDNEALLFISKSLSNCPYINNDTMNSLESIYEIGQVSGKTMWRVLIFSIWWNNFSS